MISNQWLLCTWYLARSSVVEIQFLHCNNLLEKTQCWNCKKIGYNKWRCTQPINEEKCSTNQIARKEEIRKTTTAAKRKRSLSCMNVVHHQQKNVANVSSIENPAPGTIMVPEKSTVLTILVLFLGIPLQQLLLLQLLLSLLLLDKKCGSSPYYSQLQLVVMLALMTMILL